MLDILKAEWKNAQFSVLLHKTSVILNVRNELKQLKRPELLFYCLQNVMMNLKTLASINLAKWLSISILAIKCHCSQGQWKKMMWQNIIHMITRNIMPLIQHYFVFFFFYFTINNISELNIAWFSDSPSCSQEMMWQNIIHMITKNIMALIQHFFFFLLFHH